MTSKTPGAITGGLGLAATSRGITALEAIENECEHLRHLHTPFLGWGGLELSKHIFEFPLQTEIGTSMIDVWHYGFDSINKTY